MADSVWQLERNDIEEALVLRARCLEAGTLGSDEAHVIVTLQDDPTTSLKRYESKT